MLFFKEAFLISLIILALSPMLGSLTISVSSKAIITVIAPLLMLINIIFHDYTSTSESTYRYPDSFSINAGISAAVLLASRLRSNIQILTLIYTAMSLLVLFPLFRRMIRVCFVFRASPLTPLTNYNSWILAIHKKIYSHKIDIIITGVETVALIAILGRNYPAIAVWHTLGILVISVVAPLWFQYTKKYKR